MRNIENGERIRKKIEKSYLEAYDIKFMFEFRKNNGR